MRIKRKRRSGKSKTVFADHCVKRRIMHLYDRATRKYKQNLALWKEYLDYLLKNKSYQKLNRVLSRALQLHPTCLDFWLIGAYTELDVKGNLFNGRKLILQSIRANPNNAAFYVEYFRFEIKFFEKVKMRLEILNGDKKKLDFVEDQNESMEGRIQASPKLAEIVFDSIVELFGQDLNII